MPTESTPSDANEQPISEEEFAERDETLSESLDKLEKEVFPPKTRPEPIGGMF